MPNLLVYCKRGIFRRFKVNYFYLKEKIDFLIVSPGGCGTVTLIKYLDDFGKSNLYFEKKYKVFGTSHIYKPPKFFFKNNIKVILIKRDYEGIYNSMKSRGFIRNGLNVLGDLFPFMYINVFKDQKKLKQKYFRYLDKFYNNWSKYNKELVLEINYPNFYQDLDTQKKIKSFLSIKDETFLKNFPNFHKYNKSEDFSDPSTSLMRQIHNIK
ncbi:hypothetical protein [Candidatus Pelagibacter communis]|uniref:hypothetical protein n=1 Tax=Pelagibacter ubique TaxID=198252 RepID=UPI00094D918E|nr:hypothetical protein [Candidatus Pelagibacter ubique]